MERQRLTTRLAAMSEAADKKKKERERAQERTRGGELHRNLDGFEYDPSKAAVLKKALHNANVSLGTLLAAMKELSLLRGSEITPDGMLGGRGFIMSFKDMKVKINEAITDLSDITDTLADELTNPKWGLSSAEKSKVKEEKEDIKEKVEEMEEVVPESGPAPEGTEPTELPPSETALEEVVPEDVKDSGEIESLKRYSAMIEGNVKDKVASVLSKPIVANLSKGV